MKSQVDIYQQVTDKIVAALESGTAPWLRPWKSGVGTALVPHNAVTGRAYNGINFLVLTCASYASNGWLTYKQAQELGGNVRKGEKGTQIVFWSLSRLPSPILFLILTNARGLTFPSSRRSRLPLPGKAPLMRLQRAITSRSIMVATRLSFPLWQTLSECLARMPSKAPNIMPAPLPMNWFTGQATSPALPGRSGNGSGMRPMPLKSLSRKSVRPLYVPQRAFP